jgi:Flp pilus assembly protein TadD
MKTLKYLLLALALFAAPAAANLGESDENESTNPDWLEAKKAAEAQDWKKAADLLAKAAVAEPENADIQNWLGFANRKLGNLDAAFAAYTQALKLNPRHKHAHEYIGEAYLMTQNVTKAEQHLAELQKLCAPIPCEEYYELKRAVDAYKKSKK